MELTIRIRKRFVLALVPCVLAAMAGIAFVSWPAEAASSPDTVLDNYALFALTDISMKGGAVHGGHVGVNNAGGTANVCANDNFIMDAGTQFVSDTARLTDQCVLYDTFVNNVLGGGFVGPVMAWTPPIVPGLPPLPPNNCAGGGDFVVPKNGSATITPGPYNNVDVKDNAELTIVPGVYFLCGDFDMGRRTTVNTSAGTTFNVQGKMKIGNGSNFGQVPDIKFWIAGTDNTTFGKHSHIAGHFIVPNAKILLGDGNDLRGRFWAYALNADRGVVVTSPAVCIPNQV